MCFTAVDITGKGDSSLELSKLECDSAIVRLDNGSCRLINMKVSNLDFMTLN